MVMEVEVQVYQEESSFFSSPNDENVNVVLIENRDTSFKSISARDTSATCRDSSLDNTRQTVNTYNSIMDLTRDEDDDDEEEEDDDWNNNSVLFDDLQTPISMEMEEEEQSIRASTSKTSPLGHFLSFNADSSFVDSLCTAVTPDSSCGSRLTYCSNQPNTVSSSCASQQRMQVGMDVWNLLGCASSPGDLELEEIWSLRSQKVLQPIHQRPVRVSIKQRMQRIHRLRRDQWLGPTRHGVTITTQPQLIQRASTMDDSLANLIGKGVEPIMPDDGYDSDPEFSSSSSPPRAAQTALLDQVEEDDLADSQGQDHMIRQTVQQTLNSTWTLTWHPNPRNVEEYGMPSKPTTVNIWIERGTVITQSGVVVEPTLMWRDAYQPSLSKHKLNASSQKPWTMRLLNTCRIAPLTGNDSNYPLARPSCSLYLRTCNGQEFLLETASPQECKILCERWKLVVARFASLAVMEDIDSIAKEFFHPTVTSQMLTVNNL